MIRRLLQAAYDHRGPLSSLVMRGLGVAAGFVVTFLIGRWYGPQANGQYALVTQTAIFLSIVAVGGLDLAITREFSQNAASGARFALSTFARTVGQALALALVFVTAVLVGGNSLLHLLGRDAIPEGTTGALCLILIARTFTRVLAAFLRSQERFILSQSVEVFLIPVGTIFLIAAGVARDLSGILWATAAAGLFSAAIGLGASLRHTSRAPDAMRIPASALMATALPLWGVAVTQNLSDWYGLATISAVNGAYEAGLFRVAAQYASVFSLVSSGLFGAYATRISAAHHQGDRVAVARHAGEATRISGVLMAPFAIAFIAFAPWFMGLIGPEFREGAVLLRILVIGQVGIALASPAGLVLALTGHPRINFAFTASTAAAMLVSAPFVAHAFGAIGIAAFAASALLVQNFVAHLFVRRLDGIDALTGRVLESAEKDG